MVWGLGFRVAGFTFMVSGVGFRFKSPMYLVVVLASGPWICFGIPYDLFLQSPNSIRLEVSILARCVAIEFVRLSWLSQSRDASSRCC
jgi:hypothetical protein